MSESERVVLNLSAQEANDLHLELKRQFDVAGRENCEDLVPVAEKLEKQLHKFANAGRALSTETDP